jgi:hypothetical protein
VPAAGLPMMSWPRVTGPPDFNWCDRHAVLVVLNVPEKAHAHRRASLSMFGCDAGGLVKCIPPSGADVLVYGGDDCVDPGEQVVDHLAVGDQRR